MRTELTNVCFRDIAEMPPLEKMKVQPVGEAEVKVESKGQGT